MKLMRTYRTIIFILAAILCCTSSHGHERELQVAWGDNVWRLQIDQASGALVHIENRGDPQHMNWLREAGAWERRNWVADPSPEAVSLDGQWGLAETSQTGMLHAARVRKVSDKAWEAVYVSSFMTATVHRDP
jgi:hypothetical protein